MYRFFDIFDAYSGEKSCLSVDDRLAKSSLVCSDHGHTTCHALDGRHTEILFDRDINTRPGSLDEGYESIVIGGFDRSYIFVLANFRKYRIFHGIIFPIGKDEILSWHLEKCIDDEIDTLRWRESSPGEEIIFRLFGPVIVRHEAIHALTSENWIASFFAMTGRRDKSTRIRRRIDDLTLISCEVL